MSLHLPARRLLKPASSLLSHQPLLSSHQCRAASWWNRFAGSKKEEKTTTSGPTSDLESLANNPQLRRQASESFLSRVEGGIYADEIKQIEGEEKKSDTKTGPQEARTANARLDPSLSIITTDPDPRARLRWERKKVMQMVRRNGRTTKEERIMHSEKQITMRSQFFTTSTKKLGFLARQIAGKTLDDAVTQMKFSPKKYSMYVREHLQYARSMATARKGMGLGMATGEAPLKEAVKVETKDKRRLTITDPTRIYISEAWVGRGSYVLSRIYRHGRGYKSFQKSPQATISVVLKEERTRIRQQRDKEIKKMREKPWVHLPDRPIIGQRPYYSW